MGTQPPVAHLLVGLTGSGKTSYARHVLEPGGAVRLSVDEMIFERHGRYGLDYPADAYFAKEAPVVAELQGRLVELLIEGRDVVWDHGLWPRADRDAIKEVVEKAGGRWRLLYFRVEHAELLRRLMERNHRGGANALPVSSQDLADFVARFEAPHAEGEEIIDPHWMRTSGWTS